MSLPEKYAQKNENHNGPVWTQAVRERDGYRLIYNEEGVFFSLLSGGIAGREECLAYLERKGLGGALTEEALFSPGREQPVRLSGPGIERILDEEALVEFTAGGMEAAVKLLPPDPEGKRLSREELFALLAGKHGIAFGLDAGALDALLKEREYGKPHTVARGQAPRDGRDGEIEFHFSLDKNTRTLRENEDGKIDFRAARRIENVTEGQLLVTRRPAGRGEDGMDVLGRRIAAKKGKEVAMPAGKNVVLSEDRLSLYAKISGVADLQLGKVIVSPVYTVSGDVDMASGNIDFDGDVLITGNVNSGFTVRASGSVTVNGVVEDAHIESGGDIVLKRGIQGADRGTLRAGGSIYALFIQRADAEAGVKVCADSIFHSRVRCEGMVELLSENGMLVGGVTDAGEGLASRTVGAQSGILTVVKIGASPKKRARYLEVKESLESVRTGAERLDTALKSTVGALSADHMEIRMEATKKLLAMRKEEYALQKEFNGLKAEIERASEGCVHVLAKLFPGTKICIGSAVYPVRADESYVTLFCQDGRITAQPCSYRVKR